MIDVNEHAPRIDAFHIGPQKTASTWVYRCLHEHPDVQAPGKDALQYYSMYFKRDANFYANFYGTKTATIRLDPSPSYFRSPIAPWLIRANHPDAKIICCLRNPLERAFSHYWHEKKKNRFNYDFDECFLNYDLFATWIEPSLYSIHLQRLYQCFPPSQVLVQIYDHLVENPSEFLGDIFRFLDIDSEFQPSLLNARVNVARERSRQVLKGRARQGLKFASNALGIQNIVHHVGRQIEHRSTMKHKERLENISDETREQLYHIFDSDIRRVESLIDRDLSAWRKAMTR